MGKNNLIFGIHPLIEALEAGREIDKILLKRGLRSSEVNHIMDVAKERTIPVQIVPRGALDASDAQAASGVSRLHQRDRVHAAGSAHPDALRRRTLSLRCPLGWAYRCA